VVRDVLEVAVDESLLDVEAKSNDIASVFHGEFKRSLEGEFLVEKSLLVICQHEDERHVKDLLQPACKFEGNGVAQMQTAAAGATTRVQEERLALLISIEDALEVSVAEE
jgi:hypothetical protein